MRNSLVAAAAVVFTALASVAPAQQVSRSGYSTRDADNAPQVDLWLDQISYHTGDRVAPHFVTEPGAYVTIVRVNSDGQLVVLYPRRPREQVPYQVGQLVNDRVPLYLSNDNRFQINESRGIGFVFAIASFDKFNYGYYASGGEWSLPRLTNDGRYGDPFEIVRRFVDRTLSGNSDFSLDYVSYDVLENGIRSRYASRYSYRGVDDYYDSCLSAFGLRYSTYCYNAYPGYFGPIIVSQPGNPTPNVPSSGRNLAGKLIKPVTGDPVVGGAPTAPQPVTEGRLPTSNPAEDAAWASQIARMRRDVTPRDREPTQVDTRPMTQSASPQRPDPAPRAEPTQRVWAERQPMVRAEPRVEQQRAEPRPEPVTPARVEVRNEPHVAPAPQPQAAPRTTATPAAKDQN